MVILFDTSAALALLDQRDPNHRAANDSLRRHIDSTRFVTHNYVLLETAALLQRRFGVRAVRAFAERLQPLLELTWVDRARHERALTELVGTRGRRTSLVDRVSFDLMRELGVRTAFAFDHDFERAGFTLLA